jgi:protease II
LILGNDRLSGAVLPDFIMQKIHKIKHARHELQRYNLHRGFGNRIRRSVWQNFERLVASIFEQNNFRVKVITVKTLNKKRRQYDVIAGKNDQTFLVECKKWAGNRYRLSALKKAIGQHKERTTFYEDLTQTEAVPFIVTLIEEEIRVYEGVPIVPVMKLDGIIRELDNHLDGEGYCIFEEEIFSDDDETDIQGNEWVIS